MREWILGLLKKENKTITADALNLLLDKTGANMENIKRELEKLVCYKYFDSGITAEDVEEICTIQIQNRIFDMVEAVAANWQFFYLQGHAGDFAKACVQIKLANLYKKSENDD